MTNSVKQVLILAMKEKRIDGNTERFSSEIIIADSDVAYFDGKILFFETHKMGYGYTPEGIIVVKYDNRNSHWDIYLFMKPEIDDIFCFSSDDMSIASSVEEIAEEIKFMIEKKFRETSYRIRDLTQGQNWYQTKEEIRKWLWEFYRKRILHLESDYEFNEKFGPLVNLEICTMCKPPYDIEIWEDLIGKWYQYANLTYHGNRK